MAWPAVGQEAALRSIKTLGVFSLLGDGIEVTVAPAVTDTRTDMARRETHEYRNIGFDVIAGREVREAAAKLRPGISVLSFGTNTTLPAAEQRHIASGARDGALPPWILQAVRERRLSHVLLLTRWRGDVRAATADGTAIGRGRVDGLGFYLDADYKVRDVQTGAVANGALAPHVLVELTLMDTDSAKVVRSHVIDEQFLVGSSTPAAAVDPWNYLTPPEKVLLLRETLARSLQRVLPELFKGL
ncbi:MAG: hypothetical protein KIT17_19620 [Rubrivivax sp.]|nr:hypothetical protein [Rubrivivax sp.]